MNRPFGKELIIDAGDCRGDIRSKEHLQNFVDELVEKLGMKKKGETHFVYFEDNDYNRERDIVGYTIIQVISLSNITIHINEISRTLYINIFTCGELDEMRAVLLVSDYFLPSKMKKQIITRDARSLN